MNTQKQPDPGSEYVAQDLTCTRRYANFLKDQEGFPPVYWIGRQWRVDRDAYEAWKILCYQKKGEK